MSTTSLREWVRFLASITLQRWCIISSRNCLPMGKNLWWNSLKIAETQAPNTPKNAPHQFCQQKVLKSTILLPILALSGAVRLRQPRASDSHRLLHSCIPSRNLFRTVRYIYADAQILSSAGACIPQLDWELVELVMVKHRQRKITQCLETLCYTLLLDNFLI